MFVRKKKYPSGNIGVIVAEKANGKMKELATIGVARSEEELADLVGLAEEWFSKEKARRHPRLDLFGEERRKELLGEGLTGSYDLLRLQKDLVRYEATASNPAGHFSWGMTELDGYNGSDAAPMGTLKSNDYRFLCQIPQLEITTNEAVTENDQNPFRGQ